MKRIYLPMLLSVLTSVAYSQSSMSMDFSFQIGNSFRSISGVTEGVIEDEILNSRHQHEEKFNYEIECAFNYNITQKMILRTGINYSTYNYFTSNLKDIMWPSEHDGNGQWQPDPSLPHEITNSISNSFIGVPFLLRYEINNHKLSPYLEIGPSILILQSSKFIKNTDISSEEHSIKSAFNSVNIFGRATMGMNYSISDQYLLFGGINYARQLNNFRAESAKERMFSCGGSLGLRIKLNGIHDKVLNEGL